MKFWYEPEPLLRGVSLAPFEAAFAAAAAARRWAYRAGALRSARAASPVISVGNLVAGGAGKTPVVLHLGERLRERGLGVAILSRGYGRTGRAPVVVAGGDNAPVSVEISGDEPNLLARRLPGAVVLVGPRRAELARIACERFGAEALILDDGFQHLALRRDLDIVVLDAPAPFGNGHLLPRGPLRESPRALERANLVWLSKVDLAPPESLPPLRDLALRATGQSPVESVYRVRGGAEDLAGARVLLFAGIARPESFRALVERAGAIVAEEMIFPDHFRYGERDVERARARAKAAGCDRIVCTEKDAVRLPAGADFRAIEIALEIVANSDTLQRLIEGLFGRKEAA